MTQLKKIVTGADISTPSPVLHRLFDMMFDPNCSLEKIAETISTDTGLSARTLHVANAAFSSPQNRIVDIHDAVVRLGLSSLTQILSATEVKALFFSFPGKPGDMQSLWLHNLTTACMAHSYALQLRLDSPSRWFTGGLLHDIGRLVLLRHDPVKYADIAKKERSGEYSICEAEKLYFGVSHQEVGFELMKQWLFPDEIAEAAFHHDQPLTTLDDFHTGICIANDIVKSIEADEPLPQHSGLSTQALVVSARKKFEKMKMISGSFVS
jgi:putative nucleotidyltransferase with HDIG domain